MTGRLQVQVLPPRAISAFFSGPAPTCRPKRCRDGDDPRQSVSGRTLFTAVKLAPPGNCRAALSHKTAGMSPAAGATALVQRREGGGNHQHVLLHEGLARLPALRRPDAFLAGLFSDREALGRVLVRPDVAPTVEAAEFRVPSEGQRRELHAVGDLCAPAIDDAGDAAWLQGVEADLVETAELARFELRRKRRRQKDFALLLDDEFAGVGRPALQLLRLGADAGALLEILVGPDMDDPVQRADLGVPEGGERRQLGPHRNAAPNRSSNWPTVPGCSV